MQFLITIDVEQDISKYLKNGYMGVTEGIPRILDQFNNFNVKANFFVTADVCLKYPEIVEQIIAHGHDIGCHSYDHSIEYFGREKFKNQLNDLSKATEILTETLGKHPVSFRAPNFSVNGDTIRALEKLGYTIDSSVLPGRKVKKWRLFTLLDYTGAMMKPYTPSYLDVRISGNSKILEVPLTENPLAKGSPLGLGFLNTYGLEKTIEAINSVNGDYIMFLIHPWEAVNLGKHYPNLKPWLHRTCSDDMELLNGFLEYMSEQHTFSTIECVVGTHAYMKSKKQVP